MTEHTKISWATHSFSPWIGCSKVHCGCENCYAEAMAGRLGVTWGPAGTRRRTAASTWKQVERWNRNAQCDGGDCDPESGRHGVLCPQNSRPRVFPSLCDPFEDFQPAIWDTQGVTTMADVRRDFFALIDRCQNLDFLLLTKRPENVRRMWPSVWGINEFTPPGARCAPDRKNVWLIYSASDQASLEAGLPHLLACRDLVPVLGLSLEPLVGPVDLRFRSVIPTLGELDPPSYDSFWVIVGGESGSHARPMEMEWLESIAKQCEDAGVPLFVKQDSGRKAGQQGRIPDNVWSRKEFPER